MLTSPGSIPLFWGTRFWRTGMKRRFGATVTLWQKRGNTLKKSVIKRVIRRIAQSPDEKTYVEYPFIEQLKGMWTLFLVPSFPRSHAPAWERGNILPCKSQEQTWPKSHNLSNRLFAGPSLSKNRFRLVLSFKMFRRSIPLHMIWCKAPGASILAWRGMWLHYHKQMKKETPKFNPDRDSVIRLIRLAT